jgi:hypothetical protein
MPVVICKSCGKEKAHKAHGLCLSCFRQAYNAENTKSVKRQRDLSRAKHREQYNASARQHYAKNRETIKAIWREKKYGLTPDQYQSMLDAQAGLCAICRLPQNAVSRDGTRTLHVDHDHRHNVVRGLLCLSCNTKLGLFEQPEWLEKAIGYINPYYSNTPPK